MSALGVDIGGANLKYADSAGNAYSTYFPMWQSYKMLATKLKSSLSRFTNLRSIAVTMTGEMADCFCNRSAGVRSILSAVEEAFLPLPIFIYSVKGDWLTPAQVYANPLLAAASNWRALSDFVALSVEEPTLLIDIGSTTTDILNLEHRQTLTNSTTDLDRLLSSELVYTGIERSNLAGLVRTIRVQGRTYPVVNEYFASTGDVYRALRMTNCDEESNETADGKPQSMLHSFQRLTRTIGTDADCVSNDFVHALADSYFAEQTQVVAVAIQKRLQAFNSTCESIILSGHGDFLAKAALNKIGWQGSIRSLSELFSEEVSRAACAYAVANLFDLHHQPSS